MLLLQCLRKQCNPSAQGLTHLVAGFVAVSADREFTLSLPVPERPAVPNESERAEKNR